MLAALEHPERRLPPVVHVAGTNGKGSVVAMLDAVLTAAGLRVARYTSPHLVRFNERISLVGETIGDADLERLLGEVEAVNGDAPITYFEVTTCAALLYFARTSADILLLETGLGGRLDATNVVARPRLTAITPVSLDHQNFLGETVEQIATEKAGILKPGVTAIVAGQPPAAAAAIRSVAGSIGAPLYERGRGWDIVPGLDSFKYRGGRWHLDLPRPALRGRHQIDNAGLAVACLEQLAGLPITPVALARGLRAVQWPARLQRLTDGPLAATLPPGWELWLDGGHNPAAGQALGQAIKDWRADGIPLFLMFGIQAHKHAGGFLAPLAPLVTAVRTVAIPGQAASLTAAEAATVAANAGIADVAASRDLAAALADLVDGRAGRARVLICGSLYLAGHVLGGGA